MDLKHWIVVALCAFSCTLPRPAAAQFAVIDVSSLTQLIQQYQLLKQQLDTANQALQQAQQLYASVNGARGMDQLLSGIQRNYLPTDWNAVAAALQGGGGAGSFGSSIQSLVSANAVLGSAAMARLSSTEVTRLNEARRNAALLQAISRAALSTTSARFASLQQLIMAIAHAPDSKASLDLQARIASEQTMLTNDTAKLQALYQAAAAERWAAQQRDTEQAILDIGSLSTLPPMGLQ